MEMYCRELTERFEDVWVVSGPLTLPQTNDDGKKSVTYQVCKFNCGLIVQWLYFLKLLFKNRFGIIAA